MRIGKDDARTFDNSRGNNNPRQGNQFQSQDSNSRVTNDKVRDFLQMRRDGNANATNSNVDGNRNKGSFTGSFGRNNGDSNSGRDAFRNNGQNSLSDQIRNSKKDGDQAWAKRFGGSGVVNSDRSRKVDFDKLNDGKDGKNFGDSFRRDDNKLGENRNFDRNRIDRNYQDWRKNVVDGDKHKGKDQRDWSGRWKDGERFVAANDIRNHWKDKKDRKDLPFGGDWWNNRTHYDRDGRREGGNHWGQWNHWGKSRYRPYYWWNWSSAPRLTSWITWGWPTAYYWDYGPGEYIYCNDGIVYVNGVWHEPAPTFYQRTLVLAQRAPDWTPVQAEQIEWLPLGVFVVARDGVADNNVMVQLAVTKDGVIGGTLFNRLTGASYDIQGNVDKQTQRAVWTYVDDTGARIVMESSIFNLTQPEATGLIHYGPDNIQVIELVRLEQPNAAP